MCFLERGPFGYQVALQVCFHMFLENVVGAIWGPSWSLLGTILLYFRKSSGVFLLWVRLGCSCVAGRFFTIFGRCVGQKWNHFGCIGAALFVLIFSIPAEVRAERAARAWRSVMAVALFLKPRYATSDAWRMLEFLGSARRKPLA